MFGFKNKDEVKVEDTETTITVKKDTEVSTDTDVTTDGETQEMQVPPITSREIKYLKRARYDKIHDKFKNAYVLLNKRTGQIAEINAASSMHACNIIGWKPNKVKVLEVKDLTIDKPEEITEKLGKETEDILA